MNSSPFQFPCGQTRRQFLSQAGNGFFGTAMAGMLYADGFFGGQASAVAGLQSANSLMGSNTTHFPAKAKACIFLHMAGGPSQYDTFYPKSKLNELDGKQHTFEKTKKVSDQGMVAGILKGSPFKFKRRGQSGVDVSELLPYIAQRIDDIAVIRSTCADTAAHGSACLQLNTGFVRQGFPSLGSWSLYGLGTVNQNLPGFVVIVNYGPFAGANNWSSGFIPSAYQGTVFEPGEEPIRNLYPASGADKTVQRQQLDLLARMNRKHLEASPTATELAARIGAYELAFRMQAQAPETVDLSDEPEYVRRLYGIDDEATGEFGRSCLYARRLVERGVRFVQLIHGNWDTHSQNDSGHITLCGQTDRPVAGLLTDLKQRGLLDETLVVWAGEFGRTATGGTIPDTDRGRDHHAKAFTTLLAGGGIKGGQAYGETDDLGYDIVRDPVHLHDLHATILHQMGIDHERLTYSHQGRDFRVTDVGGRVVKQLIS